MDKKLTIYDYKGSPVEITIPNFEQTIGAKLEVISGDEILTIYYGSNIENKFDSYPKGRLHGYFDGSVNVPLYLIDKISEIPDSYDALEFFGDKDTKIRVGFEAIGDLIEMATNGEIDVTD